MIKKNQVQKSIANEKTPHWVLEKIKGMYKSCNAFCDEIGRRLGEPQSTAKDQTVELNNCVNLLKSLSNFYRAGFVLKREKGQYRIESFFADKAYTEMGAALEASLTKVIPPSKNGTQSLKPRCIEVLPIIESLGYKGGHFKDDLAFHFWLYPEEELSLLVVSDDPETIRRELVFGTQALIQNHFYD